MSHKILIIGKNSFIGKSLFNSLNENCYLASREDFDLLNLKESLDFISKNKFNIVINCAISGTSKNTDDINDFYNNILLFENLLLIQEKLKFKLITFSSGAESICSTDFSDDLKPANFCTCKTAAVKVVFPWST